MCTQRITTTLQAISPIQWLPDEMLMEIFIHCLPEDDQFSRTLAPLSICWVCQVWRSVALSNSSLWKRLAFWTPSPSRRDDLCYPTRLVNQWLAHSRPLPLKLFFERGMSRNDVKTFTDLVLLEHYSRCQHLELSVSSLSARGLINFVNLPPGSLGSLESLVLDGLDEAPFTSGNDNEDDDNVLITVFESSPKLRQLATTTLDFMFHVGADEVRFNVHIIPWGPLTHVWISESINVEVFVHALVECRAIQFLRVSLSLTDEDEGANRASYEHFPPRVVLPNLTDMFLSVDGGSTFPTAMNIFHFPALTAFHFRRFYNHPEDPDPFSLDGSAHFSSQLRHIQRLRLTGRVGPTEQIISFLRRLSALTILELDTFLDYEMLLPVLFPPKAVSLLPNLAKLELHLEGLELGFPRAPLSDIIEITKNNNTFRRMRKIFPDTSQPCIFRFREMVESSKSCFLRDIRVFCLRSPTCEKSLRELRKQFRSSALATLFEKKDASSRHVSDRYLMDKRGALTHFTLT